ncbi:hypothetical protein G7Y89_g40 [Cudoniella acicularis]|uniref:Zn(2)-C6 fungal-type domain-containing protein n=1 Tax=Cudoniella acicularis TaxID=354080 RepID=A0A8H4WBJ3_9HELO|nr:hypothetical protein G7Y89_g40 [Cudoniella acicularis]
MVHTGRPSRGCAVCKRRRIKVFLSFLQSRALLTPKTQCDEAEPECSYCIKTKQKCPGYVHQFDLAWRDQTTVAKKSVERRKNAIVKARIEEDATKLHKLVARNMSQDPCLSSMGLVSSSKLTLNLEEFPLSFYFAIYATPSSQTPFERRGLVGHIAPTFLRAKPDSTIRMSIMAVATCLFLAWMNRTPDSPFSRSYYLKALSAMKDQLSKPEACSNDEMLMGVLLLQLYEHGQEKSFFEGPPGGALALIKHRGLNGFKSDISQGLLFDVRGQLIEKAYRDSQPLRDDVYSWKNIAEDSDLPPGVRLDTICMDVANLNASVVRLMQDQGEKNSHQTGIFPLLVQAAEIESRLAAWSTSIPSFWRPIAVHGPNCISPGIQRAGLYQQYCDVYPSITASGIWNKYRLAKIRVQRSILSLLSQHEQTASNLAQQDLSQGRIQLEVDNICASIPYHLGDRTRPGRIGDKSIRYPHPPGISVPDIHYLRGLALGGFVLLNPLGAVLEMDLKLREGQREWIGGQLMRTFRVYNLLWETDEGSVLSKLYNHNVIGREIRPSHETRELREASERLQRIENITNQFKQSERLEQKSQRLLLLPLARI